MILKSSVCKNVFKYTSFCFFRSSHCNRKEFGEIRIATRASKRHSEPEEGSQTGNGCELKQLLFLQFYIFVRPSLSSLVYVCMKNGVQKMQDTPPDTWILRARDRDRDILARLRFGHQRPLNRRCPARLGHQRPVNRGCPRVSKPVSQDIQSICYCLHTGIFRLDTCDLVVAGVQISISPKYLYLYLALKLLTPDTHTPFPRDMFYSFKIWDTIYIGIWDVI